MSIHPRRRRPRQRVGWWRVATRLLGVAALTAVVVGVGIIMRGPAGWWYLGVVVTLASTLLVGLCAWTEQRAEEAAIRPPAAVGFRPAHGQHIDTGPTEPLRRLR